MRLPSPLRACVVSLAVASLLVTPGAAQGVLPEPGGAVIRAPQSVLQAFGLRAGWIAELPPPAAGGNELLLQVQLAEVPRTLRVTPHDVRTAGFRLLVDDGRGLHQEPTPPSVTWRGVVDGVPDSVVAASVVQGQVQALVQLHGALFAIEPVARQLPGFPPTLHVVYDSRDAAPGNVWCGVQHAARAVPQPGPGPLALKIAEIACDADLEFYQRNGSSVATTQSTITSIMNGVDAIYQRDVQIQYRITTIMVRTTAVYVQTAMQSQLPEFGNYWNANHGGVQRDVAHLFTGKGSFSGVIGIAYLGVVCNVGNAYGVTRSYSSLTTNVGLVSHELGHNWNAPHCDSVVPCNIMCSGLGGCSGNIGSFESTSANTILAFKNSRTCLTDPVPPPTLTAISRSTIQTFNPQSVTLTGTNLNNVTRVTVGLVNAPSFTINSATSLTFTPPSLMRIQFQPVQAHTAANSSNTLSIFVQGNHPGVVEAPALILRNTAMPYKIHTDLGHIGLFYVSYTNTPSTLPGVVSFGMGNNFQALFQLGTFAADAAGQVQFTLSVPSSIPLNTVLYWQALLLNPANVTLPLETSNVATSTVFL